MAEWVPIENSIFLADLLERWKDIEIDGEQFSFAMLEHFVRNGQLTAYDKKDWIINCGYKEWRGVKRSPFLGLNGALSSKNDIIFNMDEVHSLENEMCQKITTDNSEVECLLAEAQKQVESLRVWNKRLHENNKKLRGGVENKDARIAELEKELAAAKKKITELEASNTELTTTTRTQAATEARQETVLNKWQAVFPAMCRAYHKCLTKGKQGLTRAELNTLFKEEAPLTRSQLDFFRTLLPKGYVNTTGGAPVQGTSS